MTVEREADWCGDSFHDANRLGTAKASTTGVGSAIVSAAWTSVVPVAPLRTRCPSRGQAAHQSTEGDCRFAGADWGVAGDSGRRWPQSGWPCERRLELARASASCCSAGFDNIGPLVPFGSPTIAVVGPHVGQIRQPGASLVKLRLEQSARSCDRRMFGLHADNRRINFAPHVLGNFVFRFWRQ